MISPGSLPSAARSTAGLLALVALACGAPSSPRDSLPDRTATVTTAPPPPAPFLGPKLPDVVRAVKQHHGTAPLQITLGRYAPRYVLRHAEGRYEIRQLVSDTARERADQDRRVAEGTYVPEMAWAFLVPGPVVLHDSDKAAFLRKLRTWPEWSHL